MLSLISAFQDPAAHPNILFLAKLCYFECCLFLFFYFFKALKYICLGSPAVEFSSLTCLRGSHKAYMRDMNTAFIYQKKSAFHWELQACARFPVVACKNSCTLWGGWGGKTSREATLSQEDNLLVFLELFKPLTLREGNARHLYFRGQGDGGIKAKSHNWGKAFY